MAFAKPVSSSELNPLRFNNLRNSVKIFDDQESSNIINIIKSNILIYYDNTENIKYIKIYD